MIDGHFLQKQCYCPVVVPVVVLVETGVAVCGVTAEDASL